MPTPKRRTSKSKRDMRRAHGALKAPTLSYCPETGEAKRPHYVGPGGHYKGRLVDPKKAKKYNGLSASDFE